MEMWDFWNQYKALDKFPKREVQGGVATRPSQLDRETMTQDQVSRFLYCLQQMPRAWGARPWSSHEVIKAGNNIANDLFRRKMKRDLGLR